MDRLHRIRMLLGDAAIKELSHATVMVVGIGAVGSFVTEALARSGVGNLILVDSDDVDASNINRQLFALDSTISQSKVAVAASRIADINPDIRVTPIQMFWDADSDITPRPDFVIDAIDSVDSKIALYKWCEKNNIPFISSMGAARKSDPSQIKLGRIYKTNTCPLAARVRKLARENNLTDFPVVFSTEPATAAVAANKTFGSIITVTGVFGLYMADYAINHILKTRQFVLVNG